jgi:hypothetical protein
MKILSYKILSEATVNLFNKNAKTLGGDIRTLGGDISSNIRKTTQISKRKNIEGASDTLKLMTRYIQLMFNFYDARGNAQISKDINVAFGIYFTNGGNEAHLLPYYSNSIQNLVAENLQYATLKLFDANNQLMNIENHFTNFQNENFLVTTTGDKEVKKFRFSLEIPNINNFKQINNKYKFSILNNLESFANANSQNYTIGFNASSGFRRLTLDRNSQGQGNTSIYTQIGFTVSAPTQAQQGQQGQITPQQITAINNVFQGGQQNCTITFNGQSQNTALGRFVTTIQYGNNSSIEIYTTNMINFRRNIPIDVGQVNIKSTSLNINNAVLCELSITILR